jgi:hypothetical protein
MNTRSFQVEKTNLKLGQLLDKFDTALSSMAEHILTDKVLKLRESMGTSLTFLQSSNLSNYNKLEGESGKGRSLCPAKEI